MYKARIGDVVISTAGRDKGKIFLVIDIYGKFAYIADGKVRKVLNCKKKNIKQGTCQSKGITEMFQKHPRLESKGKM